MKAKRKQNYINLIVLMFISTVLLSFTAFTIKAEEQPLYYHSIEIQRGETLNSIASLYNASGYANRDDFLFEIKRLNHLSDDLIHEGAYLVIPYYGN